MALRIKHLCIALTLSMAGCLGDGNNNGTVSRPGAAPAETVRTRTADAGREIIADGDFSRGLTVPPPTASKYSQLESFTQEPSGVLRFGVDSLPPVWQLAQWNSRYDIGKASPVEDNGAISYADRSKRVVRYPDGTLLMSVYGSAEYARPRTRRDEPWLHLLLRQDFDVKPTIGHSGRLDFSMEFKLESCRIMMTDQQYVHDIHTAQTPLYFLIQNTNPASKDFGTSLWFGIASFDYRRTTLRETERIQWSQGSGIYIYHAPQVPVWGNIRFQDNQWHTARADILPMIITAVLSMQQKGVFLHTELTDLQITGLTFGWELPGTFDATLMVRGISLKMSDED